MVVDGVVLRKGLFSGRWTFPKRWIAVLGVKGNQVRIGTAAPDGVQILWEEMLESDIV